MDHSFRVDMIIYRRPQICWRVHKLFLEDRFNFCFAPVNIRDPKAMYHILRLASTRTQNVIVKNAAGMLKVSARNDVNQLLDLERLASSVVYDRVFVVITRFQGGHFSICDEG